MENYKDKVTKGKARSFSTSVKTDNLVICTTHQLTVLGDCSLNTAQANATLIAESFNVLQDSGYTPSELLAQRNELLEALKELLFKYEFNLNKNQKSNMHLDEAYHKSQQAITNATK